MSSFLEFEHPEQGVQTLELKEPKEVAFDKITALMRCLDPEDPKESYTAYFCFDDPQHAEQHDYFLAELGLSNDDMERATPNVLQDIVEFEFTETKLSWQVQSYEDGRIYGVYYMAGELRDLELTRQQQSLQVASRIGKSALD